MNKNLILIIVIVTILLASTSFVILFLTDKVEERPLIINDFTVDTVAVIKKHHLRSGYYLPFTELLISLGYEVEDNTTIVTIQKDGRVFRIDKENFKLVEDGKSLDYFALSGGYAFEPIYYKNKLYIPTAMVQAALQNLGYSFKWECDNNCFIATVEKY